MADDDGNQDTPPADDDEKVSLSKIEEVVRKVLAEMSPGTDAPELDTDEDDDDKPIYSTRQAEDIAERAVAKAMGALKAKAPPKPKAPAKSEDDDEPKAKAPPKEPAPTPPEPSVPAYRRRLKELLVGAD